MGLVNRAVLGLIGLPRTVKRAIMIACDLTIVPVAAWLAYSLRLDVMFVPDLRVLTLVGLTTFAAIYMFARIGLYNAVIRFVGTQVLISVLIGVSMSALALTTFGFLLQAFLPRSVPFIYFIIALVLVGGSRLVVRALLNLELSRGREKVVIYGAGSAGRQLATALLQDAQYEPVAFLDDDKRLHGTVVQGLTVEKPRRLQHLITDRKVDKVLLAITHITPKERTWIIDFLSQYEVKVQTIPRFADVINGNARIEEVRDIEVEDLLGRASVYPDEDLLERSVRGKSVMVTGAGGSVGSELCRQILDLQPKMLVLFDLAEYAIYAIELELRERNQNDVPIVPILGSVQDRERVGRVIERFNVQTLYHAAAYKHVPLVEHNLAMGVGNNIFGTYATARAAIEHGVERLILISTDKAVRPTNFMGATKRFAELILQAFAEGISEDGSKSTCLSMVRFGNVLNSSGSVVPRFREQILGGGPVTITHPDIARYFMTIPEAVQLVLQAGAMSRGGEVFVLEMGEPIKIMKLARTMVQLMGKTVKTREDPDGEIEIEIIGLRPGEKLYEELLLGDNCVGTDHPMITRAMEQSLPLSKVEQFLDELHIACTENDHQRIISLVSEAIGDYQAADQIFDYLDTPTEDDRSNVLVLPSGKRQSGS